MWLDHQKAANGGQTAGTPQSSVVTSTPVPGVAAAAAAVGAAVAGSAVLSGTSMERSTLATVALDEPAQPGNLLTGSAPGSALQQGGPEANGVTAQGLDMGTVRSAVRALESGAEPPRPAQDAGSSPLSDMPVSPAGHATSQEHGEDACPADGDLRDAGLAGAEEEPASGAVSVSVEPARSLPRDAQLAEASSGVSADANSGAADGLATMADNAAELRALLTMHRAEMAVASEQLRAQFEAGQVHLSICLHLNALWACHLPCAYASGRAILMVSMKL